MKLLNSALLGSMVLFAPMQESSRLAAQGVVQGDVFVLTKGGELRRGAGVSVSLIARDSTWRATVLPRCESAAEASRYLTGPYADSVQREIVDAERRKDRIASISLRGRQRALLKEWIEMFAADMDAITSRLTARTVQTNIEARYRFEGVAAGDYFLAATWSVGDEKVNWRVPVTMTGQAVAVVDLNHANGHVNLEYTAQMCAKALLP